MMWLTAIRSFLITLPALFAVAREIMKLARDYQETQAKKAFLNEIRAGIQEIRTTGDNSRMLNLIDPRVPTDPKNPPV